MNSIAYLREIIKDLSICGKKDYIFYNFLAPNCTGRIRNCFKPSVDISPKSIVSITGTLTLNAAYPKNSQKKALLKLEDHSQFEVNGFFTSYYDSEIWVYPNGSLSLRSGYINAGAQLRCMERITIGDHCAIGRNVLIMDFDAHEITYADGSKNRITAPVSIGNRVWIGAGATILKGVTIGDNAIVGAGSVVTKNVAPNTIVAGNPAKVIREKITWK